MAFSVNSNGTTNQTTANFQADLGKIVEILKRNGYTASIISPTTLSNLAGLADASNGTGDIALATS